jgi:hypothetical protein
MPDSGIVRDLEQDIPMTGRPDSAFTGQVPTSKHALRLDDPIKRRQVSDEIGNGGGTENIPFGGERTS